ncbi:YbjN domain-containing protein [Cellulomonas fengjieae]|uniref:YbjN domain-containing protein n=1 Tax=Cellulomonas fengjieae TaxID=2819978 RepID=A0ABS3SF21_9CELL|nr:YbjN domain-containing protein [Cellulomonas fengjieae]MBO3084356.1 YbjN domain-containing protein [Cellulomonas fengjieae]MBO3103128.1 YbjN domain-containing protein [Cellulomonas fengjieae]QVI67296.1 YbjN domain-containing protein [Cellulomonas fengjieae]
MSSAPHEPTLPPLTLARVAQRLDARGAIYATDADGDLVGRWDSHPFWFMTIGRAKEYLQVRGRWSKQVPPSEFGNVLLGANRWSETMVWPKIYVRLEAEKVAVYTEHTVDYQHGVTDEQLDLHLTGGIGSALRFFAELDERYPDAVPTQAPSAPAPPPAVVDYQDPARPSLD